MEDTEEKSDRKQSRSSRRVSSDSTRLGTRLGRHTEHRRRETHNTLYFLPKVGLGGAARANADYVANS